MVKTISGWARGTARVCGSSHAAPSSLHPGDSVTLAQTELRGLARVLTFEHPELNPTIVDIDAHGTGSAERAGGRAAGPRRARRSGTTRRAAVVHRVVSAPTTLTGDLAPEERHTVVNVADRARSGCSSTKPEGSMA